MVAADVALAVKRGGRALVDEDVREHGPGEPAGDGRTGIAVGRHAVGLQRVEVPARALATAESWDWYPGSVEFTAVRSAPIDPPGCSATPDEVATPRFAVAAEPVDARVWATLPDTNCTPPELMVSAPSGPWRC